MIEMIINRVDKGKQHVLGWGTEKEVCIESWHSGDQRD